jgi:hypothetical protein
MKVGIISLGKSVISDVGMQLWCLYMMPIVGEFVFNFNTRFNDYLFIQYLP